MATFRKTLRNSAYRLVLEMNQGTPNVANNTSPVSYSAYVEKTSGSGYVSSYSHPYNIKINGKTVKSGSFSGYNFKNYSRLSLGTGTVPVAHNSNGTKTVSGSAYFEANQSGAIGSATVSGNLALSRIARESTLTAPNSFVLGNSFDIKLDRQDSSFFHYVDIKLGSTMLWSQRVETSATVLIDRNQMLDLVPNSNSASLSLVYSTRTEDSSVIGVSTKTITCNLNAPNPSISGITNTEAVDSVASLGVGYVQTKSMIRVALVGVEPGRGARIVTTRITVDSQVLNATSGVTQPIQKSGNITIVGTVTDSRGKTFKREMVINVVPYSNPKITSIKAFRSKANGDRDDYGTYVKFEVGHNITSLSSKNIKRIKIKIGSNDTWVALPNYVGTYIKIFSGFDVNNSFPFTITVDDYFGNTVTSSIIPNGAVTMMWGKDNMSIGTTELKEPGSLNVKGQGYQQGGKKILDENSLPETVYINGVKIKKYIDGTMEQYGNIKGNWTIDIPMGNGFRQLGNFEFPIKFIDAPESVTVVGTNYVMMSVAEQITKDSCPIRFMSLDRNRVIDNFYFEAKGRWK
ncbi:DUF859 domain-containing protein [Erysipelothrix urinaevulpis]|uniref:DUF859 family phage minor structural protein n=1 Tax=Erysipelothrix urinaevulpis TaxID=2683717 RepID=UPI001357E07F|nr:DUF859 family phage minor structural protein [Erysipelothrix urinaevulpis]